MRTCKTTKLVMEAVEQCRWTTKITGKLQTRAFIEHAAYWLNAARYPNVDRRLLLGHAIRAAKNALRVQANERQWLINRGYLPSE